MITVADFLAFIRAEGIAIETMPDDGADFDLLLEEVFLLTPPAFNELTEKLYKHYQLLLAMHFLLMVGVAQDTSTIFTRAQANADRFRMTGQFSSISNAGTSVSIDIPTWASDLLPEQLVMLSNPYGRKWLDMLIKLSSVVGYTS